MDNKITKKRLSDFFAYEWIAIIAVTVAVIIFWELVYSITSVKVTVGQQFKLFYDYSVSSFYLENLVNLEEKNQVFSDDILDFNVEILRRDYDLLDTRLQLHEGDILITDCYNEETEGFVVRVNSVIDTYNVYSFENLVKDAEKYLSIFLKDGETDMTAYSCLDPEKIRDRFLIRERGDNRFRTEEQKQAGFEREKIRIEKLCKETVNLKYLLENHSEIFYQYTRFTQKYNNSKKEEDRERYQRYIQEGIERGDGTSYGIKAEALNNGRVQTPLLFRKADVEDASSKDVVIIAFDFWDEDKPNDKNYQYDLQFEVIPFITMIVKECSDIVLPF